MLKRILPSDMLDDEHVLCPFCACECCDRPHKYVDGPGGEGVQFECTNCAARGPVYGDRHSAFLGFKYGDNSRQEYVEPNARIEPGRCE